MKSWLILMEVIMVAAGSLHAGPLTTVSEQAVAESVKVVDAEIKLATGRFDLLKPTHSKGVIAELHGEYNEDKYKYDYYFKHSHRRGEFYFSSETNSHFRTNIETKENNWEMSFSPDVELRFNIDIGAAETDFDFADLAISEFELNVGAVKSRIDFSTPNKTDLTLFRVKAGACDLEVNNIGNARFDRLEFDGGVGSFTLDFSGQFDYRADAKITVGLGSVDIIIPSEIGVRLQADDNFLNSIDFSKRKLKPVHGREDVFETDNFDTARGQLTMKLEVGMGSANIKFR